MATKTQIENQLSSLGCNHTLPHLRAAAFILLHVNPAAFNRLEMHGEARISEHRTQSLTELVEAIDPMLWVDMAKTVCDRLGGDIHTTAGEALRSFMNVFPKHVPTWVPISIFLLLAIPKDSNKAGESLRRQAMESIKVRAKEARIHRVCDHVRHAALAIYSRAEPAEIAHAYLTVFQRAYQ